MLEPLECGRQQRQGWPPVLPHRIRAVTAAAVPAADRRVAEVEEVGKLSLAREPASSGLIYRITTLCSYSLSSADSSPS